MVSKSTKIFAGVAAVAVIGGVGYAVTQGSDKKSSGGDYKVAMITDSAATVQDRSFNQITWEGLQAWGKENNVKQGQGYNYFLSKSPSDFDQNFKLAQKGGYDMQAGIGFSLNNTIKKAAKSNPKTDYVLVDDIVTGQKNVTSLMFRSEESSYLAGVAAATKAKEIGDNQVGFVGGIQGSVIDRFQAGYIDGVKSVDPNIKVNVIYANSFTDASKGNTIAKAMIANGNHVIFVAAGSVGNGVFTAAKQDNELLNADSKERVFVIGVDMDQAEDGTYTSKDGKKVTSTLTSSLTQVGNALKDTANKGKDGKLQGGKTIWYGLKEKGVGITTKDLSPEELKAVNDAQAKILDGSLKVNAKPESYKAVQ